LFPKAESPPVSPIGQIGETQDEVSDEDWIAENEQTALSWKAEYRKRLEEEARYSWEARERLLAEIEQEESEQALAAALAACAEDERRREAIKAEAESSSLNALFDFGSWDAEEKGEADLKHDHASRPPKTSP
jgi:hypothetical protein